MTSAITKGTQMADGRGVGNGGGGGGLKGDETKAVAVVEL